MNSNEERDSPASEEKVSDRASADDSLSCDLAAILADQLRVNLRTVDALQRVLGSPAPAGRPQPWDTLQHRRKAIEDEAADLLARNADHAARLRQFEADAQECLSAISEGMFAQIKDDCRESIERVEKIVSVLEQAEASIAALCHSTSGSQASPPSDPPSVDEPQPTSQSDFKVAEAAEPASPPAAASTSSEPADPAPQHSGTSPSMPQTATPQPQDAEEDDNRRTTSRLRVEGLDSNLGSVVDLSRGGAQVLSSKPLEGQVTLEIAAGDVSLAINATVAWCERHTWRHYAAGLQFGELSEEDSRKLTQICMDSRKRTTIAQ